MIDFNTYQYDIFRINNIPFFFYDDFLSVSIQEDGNIYETYLDYEAYHDPSLTVVSWIVAEDQDVQALEHLQGYNLDDEAGFTKAQY